MFLEMLHKSKEKNRKSEEVLEEPKEMVLVELQNANIETKLAIRDIESPAIQQKESSDNNCQGEKFWYTGNKTQDLKRIVLYAIQEWKQHYDITLSDEVLVDQAILLFRKLREHHKST